MQVTGPSGTINNLRWYGDELTTANHAGLTGNPVDFENYTVGSPLAVTGSTTLANTDFGNYVVYQLTVATSASPGATNQENYTWLYDES